MCFPKDSSILYTSFYRFLELIQCEYVVEGSIKNMYVS